MRPQDSAQRSERMGPEDDRYMSWARLETTRAVVRIELDAQMNVFTGSAPYFYRWIGKPFSQLLTRLLLERSLVSLQMFYQTPYGKTDILPGFPEDDK